MLSNMKKCSFNFKNYLPKLNENFSVIELFSSSFKIYGQKIGRILLAQLIVLALSLLPLVLILGFLVKLYVNQFTNSGNIVSFPTFLILTLVFTIFYILYISFIQAGLVKFYLNIKNEGETLKSSLKTLFSTKRQVYFKYLLFSIIFALMVIGGFFLLILPAIIVLVVYSFAQFFVIEKGLKPMEALKESAKLTRDYRWNIFLVGITMFVVYFVFQDSKFFGNIISYFVVQPIFMILLVEIYKGLSLKKGLLNTEEEHTEVVVQPKELEKTKK
jgi:hypothetical protein